MNQNEMIDVFISYRREGGSTVARLLYEVLKAKKITGFMDVETLTRGDYEASILSHIKKARNFILVVSVDVMKSPWVQKEIMYALEHKKNVIPVFVNGVTCFPHDVPADIKAVDVNGICLNHDNFHGDIEKLISWLDTRHNVFTHQYVEMWKEEYTSEKLLAAIKKIAGSNQIKEFLIDKFKNALQYNCSVEALQKIFEEYFTDEIKFMLENIGVECKGSRENVIIRIHHWLNNETIDNIKEDENENSERIERLSNFICSTYYGFKKDLKKLQGICVDLGLKVDGELTAAEYMFKIVNSSDVCNARMLISVTGDEEWRVKEIAFNLLGSDVGRKNNLIDAIDRWVNYQDE
ncbi:toll/interleukin-1 receptor domain-containing protein [Aeromonas allosaccharophila]|uniref:toll/interleukin-1 receptor domain-containing protein n=1 Tax=Aeromonas allosaccharophila TaxID=656 RepID=UPI003D1F27E2